MHIHEYEINMNGYPWISINIHADFCRFDLLGIQSEPGFATIWMRFSYVLLQGNVKRGTPVHSRSGRVKFGTTVHPRSEGWNLGPPSTYNEILQWGGPVRICPKPVSHLPHAISHLPQTSSHLPQTNSHLPSLVASCHQTATSSFLELVEFIQKPVKFSKTYEHFIQIVANPDPHWIPNTSNLQESAWISCDIHTYPFIFIDMHGYPYISMISMDIYGYPWISMHIHAYPCISTDSIDIHRYPWISMDLPSISMDIHCQGLLDSWYWYPQ